MPFSKFSHLLLGVAIGVGLTASAGAYAATTSKIGKKIAGEISIYLNGQAAPSKAIVVDGTSYLPVRWTAEAAGLGLELKNKNVYLTKSDAVSADDDGAVDEIPSIIEIRLKEIDAEGKEIESRKKEILELTNGKPTNDPELEKEYNRLLERAEDLKDERAALEAQR